jgi:hypothetical protein
MNSLPCGERASPVMASAVPSIRIHPLAQSTIVHPDGGREPAVEDRPDQ